MTCAAAVLCFLSLGCGNTDVEDDLQFLNGRFITGKAVSVFPNRHWQRHAEMGGSFRKAATLLIWVEKAPPGDLVFSLSPDGATSRFHFFVSWDNSSLWSGSRSGGGKPLEAEIAGEMLVPGLHRLTVERRQEDDAEADRGLAENQFSRVRVFERSDGQRREIDIRVNPFIASFLDFGVTGQSPVREDGCLFDGPQRLVHNVQSREQAQASFILENRSRKRAVFKVEIGAELSFDFPVPARGRLPINFEIPRGNHRMAFEVEGLEGGSFLWGAPFLSKRGAESPVPPVIFLTLDTTRRDSVAPFSAEPGLTPNLAVFADHATVFSNAWATAPWTLPSHASMFTGLYPSHHGAGVTDDALALDRRTLAEELRNNGYRTGGFIGGHMSSSVFGIAQGFSVYHDPEGWEATAAGVTDDALSFIEENSESPFFAFINYFDPHEPYEAPEEYRDLIGVEEAAALVQDDPVWGPLARGEAGSWNALRLGKAPSTEAGIAFLRKAYLAEIAFMDAQIGRLFDGLRQRGIYDDALIVVVADHGEFLGEGGLYSHSYRLDPELTRVPLLIKWPGQREGETVTELVSHVDVFGAVAAAVGVEVPMSDGYQLAPGSQPSLTGRDFVFMEEHACRIHQLLGPNKIADHLFGLQWRDRREVMVGRKLECLILEAGAWLGVPCTVGWDDRAALLSEQMLASARLTAEHSPEDLADDEAEKLRALGYLE